MSFRITTNGLFRSYRSNLSQNQKNLTGAMEKVQTQRNFNSYAEDPAEASKAFQLRRNYWRTGSQIENSDYVISKFETGFQALDPVVDGQSDGINLSNIKESILAITDTSGSGRQILGTQIKSTASSVMMLMNVRYNDEYVFAGADGLNTPFTMEDGKLMYRGVDVNAPKPLSEGDFNALGGDYSSLEGFSGSSFDDYKTYYKDQYGADYDKAAMRFDESTFVDIGLGMTADENGDTIPSSAYNSSLSGLDFLGYGTDEDGDSKNLVNLMNELGDIYVRCDVTTGAFASGEDRDRALVLTGKLRRAIDHTMEQHVRLSAETNYLKTNKEQLQETKLTLNTQIEQTERMEMADAITGMMWANYCYNAALRVGADILSPSLIDYLR